VCVGMLVRARKFEPSIFCVFAPRNYRHAPLIEATYQGRGRITVRNAFSFRFEMENGGNWERMSPRLLSILRLKVRLVRE
jgi:hypothetical protein